MCTPVRCPRCRNENFALVGWMVRFFFLCVPCATVVCARVSCVCVPAPPPVSVYRMYRCLFTGVFLPCLFTDDATGVPAPPGVFLPSRPRGAVDSGLAAVLAAVESVAVFVRACVFGFGWMVVRFVRVIRLPACARVSRVSRV